MKFKKGVDIDDLSCTVDNEGFWYAVADGGWIQPKDVLIKKDAEKVDKAIEVLREFEALIPPL